MCTFWTIKKNSLIFCITSVFIIFSCLMVWAFTADEEPKDAVKVPILMYHSVLKNKNSSGTYVVTPELFENDLLYLKNNGYTTIFTKELSDYVRNGAKLPEKPVIITLDDGYYNNYIYVLPLLEKYDMKASIAVVGKFTDIFSNADSHNANYSHLTWEDISELHQTGKFEFSNHTYDMHSSKGRIGCFKKKNESVPEYQNLLKKDILKMQNLLLSNSGIKCEIFTYPYGKIANDSIPVIKEMGFLASLSCYEKINYITLDENCLYQLGRFNRPAGISTENFMKKNGI